VKNLLRNSALFAALVVAAGVFEIPFGPGGMVIAPAEARVGRPMTPVSVAGVARRTTRRTVRRVVVRRSTAVYVEVLPPECIPVSFDGAQVYQCGGVYFQADGARYVVVEVQ